LRESTLHHNKYFMGDCIDILKTLPEKSIDLVFADPPYYLQLNRNLWRPNKSKVDSVDDTWDKFNNFQDYDLFTQAWLSACKRLMKDESTLWVMGSYHNIFRIGKILQDLDFWILNDIIWIKNNPMPNFRGVRFTNAHETLIWAQKKKGAKYTFNHHSMKALNDDLQMRSDWYMPLCSGHERCKVNGEKAHTTQKPESLLYRLILSSTKPGDTVLDPFFGTGTTGAVAKKLGRYFIGIEKNPDYIHIAKKRISKIKTSSEPVFTLPEPKSWARVPFGRLIEEGLLSPGQVLTLRMDNSIKATVLAHGHIQSGIVTGSIHYVAKTLLDNTAVNGWDAWLFNDNDKLIPINALRRSIAAAGVKNEP